VPLKNENVCAVGGLLFYSHKGTKTSRIKEPHDLGIHLDVGSRQHDAPHVRRKEALGANILMRYKRQQITTVMVMMTMIQNIGGNIQ